MTSLIVIGLITAYVAVFVLVIRNARSRAQKVGATVIAMAIPFWDLPIGYLGFFRQCAEFGGVRTEQNLGTHRSILVHRSAGYTPEEVFRYGFETVEYLAPEGTLVFTRNESGHIKKVVEPSTKSSLRISHATDARAGWNLRRSDYTVARISDGHIVASQTDFHWPGMWWQVAGAPLFGDGHFCLGSNHRPVLAVITGMQP